jgi:SAM-dependent methyltransferase
MVDALKLLRRARKERSNTTESAEQQSAAPAEAEEPSRAPAGELPAEEPSSAPDASAPSTSSALGAPPPEQLSTRRWRSLRIAEDPSGSLSGGNGATVWDSALVLARLAADGDLGDWDGARVLELGAGCGLVACALATLGARVTATERRIALPLLERNVEANAAAFSGSVDVAELDWAAPGALGTFDRIVGTDLVFASNADVHGALADLLATLVRGAVAYVVSEVREGGGAEGALVDALRRRGLAVTRRHADKVPDELRVYEIAATSFFDGATY